MKKLNTVTNREGMECIIYIVISCLSHPFTSENTAIVPTEARHAKMVGVAAVSIICAMFVGVAILDIPVVVQAYFRWKHMIQG